MAVELYKQLRPILSKGLELFSKSIPYISKALSGLLSTFMSGISFVKRWWMELALAGSIIGIVTLAINTKTIAITAYAGVMGAVSLATQAWTAMQWLLNIALTANPIGLVVVGVAALTAGSVYLWHKFAGFRAFLVTAWDSFKKLGSIIKDYVVDRIHEMLEGLGKVGRALQLLLQGEFSEAWSTFKEGVSGVRGLRLPRRPRPSSMAPQAAFSTTSRSSRLRTSKRSSPSTRLPAPNSRGRRTSASSTCRGTARVRAKKATRRPSPSPRVARVRRPSTSPSASSSSASR